MSGEEKTERQLPVSELTLRDYFAAKAMAVLINGPQLQNDKGAAETVAECAYLQADAMLAERTK